MTGARQADPSAASRVLSAETGRTGERLAFVEDIRAGLPFEAVVEAAETLQVTIKDLADFGVIPMRTLSHSKKSGRFSQVQSDRVARFFRVWREAQETFGEADRARRWMERPTRPLGDQSPVSLLDTEEGARLVEALLGRIDHGLAV